MGIDKNFHKNHGPFTLGEISAHIGAQCDSQYHDVKIEDVAPLQTATKTDISFLDNPKYKESYLNTNAAAVVVSTEMAEHAPQNVIPLITKNPYKAYALTAQLFYPFAQEESISPDAIIHPSVKIGKNCTIEAGAVIHENVQIGDNCKIGSNAIISHAIIGNNVSIYRGACIGQDGFGFAIDPSGFVKVPQLGRVIIEDNVEIGANTTIDRGSGPDTIIGTGTWIDNLVQIGHNVKIGKGCVIVAQVGISGSTELGDYVMIGGQAGIAGHLKIGSGAKIAAGSGVIKDIAAGEEQMGYPSVPIKQFFRQVTALKHLIKRDKK